MEWLSIADVAKQTGLAENTARRYAKLFSEWIHEKQFGRTTKYAPESLEIMDRVSRLYKDGKTTTEIQELLRGTYAQQVDITPEEEVHAPIAIAEIRQLVDYVKHQEQFNKELMEKLEGQQRLIEESILQRDEKLMVVLRELTEAKKQAAAAKWWKWW